MKPFLLAVLFATVSLSTYSQTKKETEDWIKEKFVTYFEGSSSKDGDGIRYSKYHDEKNITVSFSGCNLIITTEMWVTEYTSDDINKGRGKPSKYSHTNKSIIPINNIKDLDNVSSGAFMIRVHKKSIKEYSSINHGKTYTFKQHSDVDFIYVNLYGEQDLKDRLIKAFRHLMTYCPSSNEAEPF